MTDAQLKLYSGVTEYGTGGNPISFGAVLAGQIVNYVNNPLYLWNDKGGILDSVPANTIEIQAFDMWIQDENMGVSNGLPTQTFTCLVIPLIDNSNAEEIIVKVGTVVWNRVGSFTGTASDATIYMINSITGVVTFGDGVNGAIPTLGQTIYITYMPDLLIYGNEIFENTWLEVKSYGVTSNSVIVIDEQQTSTSTINVMVANTLVLAVTGVWLQTDPGHSGTNYYTGGSFDAYTGLITLGTPLAGATTGVLINYTYVIDDDAEADYSPIGKNTTHTFQYQIPKNNAKLLYFRLNVPDTATASGGSQVNFRIRLKYRQ